MSKTPKEHRAIFFNNQSDYYRLIDDLISKTDLSTEFDYLKNLNGVLFSKRVLNAFIEEEEIHDKKLLTSHTKQSLKSMSSGEQKKTLLSYLLHTNPDFLILLNPFDNLDINAQKEWKRRWEELAKTKHLIFFLSRKADLLPFLTKVYALNGKNLQLLEDGTGSKPAIPAPFTHTIPEGLDPFTYPHPLVVKLTNVSVQYGNTSVLNNINWVIRPAEFWKLSGPNGSGKTTLLSMINGDNPKAYGQDIYLLGHQKGSGESVWDIKKQMGYFTPSMIDRFKGYHTLENMLISGLYDSIGLYIKPGNAQQRLATEWLKLIGLDHKKDKYFHTLNLGEKHLIMCIRAMIKHPALLILDEPTAGLDDTSAAMVVALINKMAEESETTIIFVSHREEPLLQAPLEFALKPTPFGSEGERTATR